MRNEAGEKPSLGSPAEGFIDDVHASLEAGIAAGARFEDQGGSDELFDAAVRRAITAIESNDKDELLPRFLSIGPYIDPIPPEVAAEYMSDADVAAAIRFIHSSAINAFQGALAEMLAVRPVVQLAREIGQPAGDPGALRAFVGDTVKARPLRSNGWAKAADFHLLSRGGAKGEGITVRGVVEVKSYPISAEKLWPQVDKHLTRARRGLQVQGEEYAGEDVVLEGGIGGPAQIVVVPDTWELPRSFRFETHGESSCLEVEPPAPPAAEDRVERLAPDRWQVTLRWSQEALADEAYAMTFWYMGELGRLLYAERGVPAEWSEMTPEQAGQNAVKMQLYYAILRARTVREESRAIALYNSYGFGYALGSNFVDRHGRREVLFYEDLEEILATGRSRTKAIDKDHMAQRCRIRGYKHRPADAAAR
jgi:hypothetical protein